VLTRFAFYVLEDARCGTLHRPEPTKEQNEIDRLHTVFVEVRLLRRIFANPDSSGAEM
jgi:hypothetical protein